MTSIERKAKHAFATQRLREATTREMKTVQRMCRGIEAWIGIGEPDDATFSPRKSFRGLNTGLKNLRRAAKKAKRYHRLADWHETRS